MPFLGAAIAVWIVFSIGVLACYFIFIAPSDKRREREPPPWQSPVDVSPPRWDPPPRSQPRRSGATYYDMSNPMRRPGGGR